MIVIGEAPLCHASRLSQQFRVQRAQAVAQSPHPLPPLPPDLPLRLTYDRPQYPVEVLNRAAGVFRMAGHMLGQRLLLFLLRLGLFVVFVDDDQLARQLLSLHEPTPVPSNGFQILGPSNWMLSLRGA